MRRGEAILVIVALLAMPLVLLAGTGAGAGGCGRYCCLPHAAQNSPMSPSENARQTSEMACHRGKLGHLLGCGMNSRRGSSDVALLAPIPPTLLSTSAKLAAPEILRQAFDRQDESSTAGIFTAPFQPPRS